MMKAAITLIALGFSGIAHAQSPLPPNTIDCTQFRKVGDAWTVVGLAVFDLGNFKRMTMAASTITPHSRSVGGYDLYTVLEAKCGAK